jgi:hypothetical protein
MDQIFKEMGEFSVEIFNDATSIEHMKKLKIEADEVILDPSDLFEYADCLLAFFAAAYKAGFTYENIEDASRIKLEVLKSRKWNKLDDGTYQHIKES